ncbi:hypothetical protein HmCmsJML268_04205 [Escherichia coli]|nr:hypothetical protein HmCmsJML021_03536 [Escherichia coli]GDE91221.1 hypothetical protein HmCmsJML268_04205 [Escherichia coli]
MVLNVGNGAVSDAHDDVNIQRGLCAGGFFAQLLLALDEVSADLAAFFVALDHCQFFGGVQDEVVVFSWYASIDYFPILGNNQKVLIFYEFILADSLGDPSSKAFTYFEKGVHHKYHCLILHVFFTGIDCSLICFRKAI